MTAAAPTSAQVLRQALVLSLGAAVSLGLARFAYALLLPAMRADLGWSYFTAGAMNTANAAGYLLGALLLPQGLKRLGARPLFLGGAVATAALLSLHAAVRSDVALALLRLLSGMASAATFVCGGLLAAHLASQGSAVASSQALNPAGAADPRPDGRRAAPRRAATAAGLVLGLYYGGTGLGIVASALLVPWLLEAAPPLQAGWPSAWMGLGLLAAMCALVMVPYTPTQGPPSPNAAGTQGTARFVPRQFAFALAAYLMFGLGYIGYMTFIISLLREQHMAVASLSAFYVLLGLGVLASSWLWAGLLQRQRDGRPLAVLNGLLALATLLPVLTAQAWAAFVSGALFGSVFLSVVAATTAIVRHNLPSAAWAAGISGFTVIFALGQIVGPGLVGALSDGAGGLRAGFIASAVLLAAGALLACGQRALPLPQGTAR